MFTKKSKQTKCNTSKKGNDSKHNIRLLKGISAVLDHYCQETSLHGFRYIPKSNRSPFRMVLWLTVCLTGIVFCCVLIQLQWNRYHWTPTITSIENTNYAVWDVPFPAVTICNFNKVYKPAANILITRLVDAGMNETLVMRYFKSLVHLLDYKRNVHLPEYVPITEMLLAWGYTPDKLMLAVAQPCNRLIRDCTWLGIACLAQIKLIKSEGGFCCSFNYNGKSYSNISMKESQNKEIESGGEILRMPGSGRRMRLYLQVAIEPETYVTSIKSAYGAEASIHGSIHYPEVSVVSITFQPSVEVGIVINPSVIESAKDVRNIPVELRQCLFDDEVSLNSSFEYSYPTCLTECRAKEVVKICGCVPFFYSNKFDRVPYCGLSDTPCLVSNRHLFYSVLQSTSTTHAPIAENGFIQKLMLQGTSRGLNSKECNCYPQCSDSNYDIKAAQFRMTSDEIYSNPYQVITNTSQFVNKYSIINIFYKDLTCTKYIRNRIMSWNDLIASYGGIFGLCVGGSVISIFEFFYILWTNIFDDKGDANIQQQRQMIDKPKFHVIKKNKLYWNELIPGKHQIAMHHY